MSDGKAITKEEIHRMLFWYTVFDGNINKTAIKHSEDYGINRSRKVVGDVARRENFAVKSHLVRDQVNQHLFSASAVGGWNIRMLKMALDLLDIDEKIVKNVKLWFDGKYNKSTFDSSPEALAAIKQVTSDIANLSKNSNPKQAAFQELEQTEGKQIALSLETILGELDEEDKEELLDNLAAKERQKILEG